MGRKTQYYLVNFFQEEFKKLIDAKKSFEYIRTSFTKKLKTERQTIIFNNDGIGDDLILSLINRVRKDAIKFMEANEHKINDNEKIYFLDMFSLPVENEITVKVDLTSAYWRFSKLENVITKETDDYFNTTFADRTEKERKEIRLKALGSLATRKQIETFENGKSVNFEVDEQQTKRVYMHVCRQVDKIMRDCAFSCEGCIFYYWDCMFVRKQYEKEIIDFFRAKQFECKTEETYLSYDKIGTKEFFFSECDGKMYMVEKGDEKLVNTKFHEYE